jgi:hypothetical protein
MKYFILILIFLSMGAIFSQETQENRTPKRFYIPASEFIQSGFKVSFSGSSEASHSNTGGRRHDFFPYVYNILFRNTNAFNLNGGQLQRDNILTENIENYSYLNQPYEKVSPLAKVGLSYTTKSSDWTFDFSFRGQNYSGKYTAGNNVPFEYYPGSFQYHWREGQYSIIRNHAIYSFIMVQPQLGIREIHETYLRNSDTVSYPLGNRYSSVNERSKSYSQQAGLTFHFKIIESLRIKVTGKIFQGINGDIRTNRTDLQYNGVNYSGANIQSRMSRVYTDGNELEGEISYSIKKVNLFLGYNLTEFTKDPSKDPNFIPTIVTNNNLENEYSKYYLANSIYEARDASGFTEPRYQRIRYFYFGASFNF